MNSNPLKELSKEFMALSELVVLGIAYTQIEEIPKEIIQLTNLKQLNCYGSPLKEPINTIARRGVKAVQKYFNDQNVEVVDQQNDEQFDDGKSTKSHRSDKSKTKKKSKKEKVVEKEPDSMEEDEKEDSDQDDPEA